MSTAARTMTTAVERRAEFTTTYGAGALVIGLCAEYDALPELGHACGHNIIVAVSTGAALALREVADSHDLTIKLLGTPAEEASGGKVLLPERGVLDEVAAAMMVHPAPDETCVCSSLAITGLRACYLGTAYGIVTHGGAAPNIIPAIVSAVYHVRAFDAESLQQLEARVRDCFAAGAVATGCTHEVTQVSPVCTQLVPDSWIAAAYGAAITGLGRTPLSVEDERTHRTGSTDMGTVSAVLPSIHPTIAIDCGDAVNHQPEFASACATPSADRAVCDGALALALAGLAVATDHAQRDRLLDGVSRRHRASEAGGAV